MNADTTRYAMRVREAAVSLGLSVTKIRQLIADGRLEAIRLDGRILITPDAVRNFLDKCAKDGGR